MDATMARRVRAGPLRRLLEFPKPDMRHAAGREHAEQQRVERAQMARLVGRPDGELRIVRPGVDEGDRVVAEREIRTELHGTLEFAKRLLLASANPERPPHGPVRGRILVIGQKALAGRVEGRADFLFAVFPALEGILPVGERHAGMSARDGRAPLMPYGRRASSIRA